MVGELDIAIADQSATILCLSDHVVLRVADYRSALTIVNHAMPGAGQIGKLLSFNEIGLSAQLGKWQPIELFPQPSLIVRWLIPAVRELVHAENN